MVVRTSREQNRTNLGFADAVVDAFRFLGTKYDFSLVEFGPTLVRYESPELFIRLYHGVIWGQACDSCDSLKYL